MLYRFFKKFFGIFTVITAIGIVLLMILILSDKVKAASDHPYEWIPYLDNPTVQDITQNGLYIGQYSDGYLVYVYAKSDNPAKCCGSNFGGPVLMTSGGNYYIYCAIVSVYDNSVDYNSGFNTPNMVSLNRHSGFTFDNTFPYYPGYQDARNAMDDGNWTGSFPEPEEPEYNYDNSLGALKNIQIKQIAQGIDGFVSVTYDQYTTTNVDLSQNGYGVMSKLVVKDTYSSNKVFSKPNYIMDPIGGFYVEVDSSGNFRYDKLLPDIFNGGGGHSFDYPEGGSSSGNSEEIYPGKTVYDLFLWPYYYDGSDYTYGLGQLIENIKYDRIGQQMYTIEDPEEIDPDQNLNVTRIIERRIELENNETYYDTDNIENIVEIYNYTYVDNSGDTITNNDFSNVDNSTTNIYNYENNYITENQWSSDVDPTDILSIIKHLLNWVANDFLVKSGLFNYLPSWSLGLASGILAALATLLTFKVIRGS